MKTLIALILAGPWVVASQEKPVCKDKTGVAWVLPFTSARGKSTDLSRLLLIKPIAFGTTKDGGW